MTMCNVSSGQEDPERYPNCITHAGHLATVCKKTVMIEKVRKIGGRDINQLEYFLMEY